MTSIKTLSDKAILISLNISCFTGGKKDKIATQQVVDDNNVIKAENNVRVWKSLMKGKEINKVVSCSQKIRLNFYKISACWGENVRIVKIENFQKVKLEIEKNIREFKDAVSESVLAYDRLVEDDKVKLGNLFNPTDYPSKASFASSFSANISVMQIEKADFRNAVLSTEDIEDINKQIEQRIKNNAVELEKELISRVSEKVQHLLSRLSDNGKFHQSSIDNIVEAIQEARNLNINDNPKIDNLFDKIEESMGTLSAESIRESYSAKSRATLETVDCMKNISEVMKDFDF
jgi:predicted outer membrane protein